MCSLKKRKEKSLLKTCVGISSALSAFYSLFLTISAVVLELSHVLSEEEEREVTIKDMIFGMYMYGVSILFFFYMYIVLLLNPQWYWAVNVLQTFTGWHKGIIPSRLAGPLTDLTPDHPTSLLKIAEVRKSNGKPLGLQFPFERSYLSNGCG
ncbi:unnamed protein product [Haemonchus placei]|uniref:Palmitoyltransferase n=1 Tax=Haemonchus placei TaxID=6290 RepID=A0A0N4X735_HAEPC|nr:unnamed protein product [Haemonchus placei]